MSDDHATPAGKGPLRDLEGHVAVLLGRRASQNVNVLADEERRTFGQRASDAFARAVGSWIFIIAFMGFIVACILLILVLSCVAAAQAPVILMSQNREEVRDRVRAQADYEVNLKAEILLEHLTEEVELLKAMLTETQEKRGD